MAYDLRQNFTRKRISFIYVFYWLMLVYIVAALVFWFISLAKQNNQITRLRLNQLEQRDPDYAQRAEKIHADKKLKTVQYAGEGITFLVIIFASAVFVFRMLRTQLKLSRQQRDFMMAITHELKTPIAVTKLNLETMQKRQLDITQQQRLIQSTLAEADRLNALCNNMLLLNEVGASYTISKEDIDLNELISECVSEHENRAPLRQFHFEPEPDVHIYGDRVILKLAINNLLDNAVKYSPKESAIVVRTFIKNNQVIVQVIDEGDGIPEAEAQRIFQKYYRGKRGQAKGTGLGLYVTRQIVQQSKAKLEYQPNNPKGSIFTITFLS